jgi:3-deoxy-D-manno-octulosonic-acid transferase
MHLVYNLFIHILRLLILTASLVNGKARDWVAGRKGLFRKLENAIHQSDKIIWFHCASLGEFEQGRPVIEGIRSSYPKHKILLTFFSSSGYEIRKNYEGADFVFYMPLDTLANARRFIGIVKPRLVFFIKYEFWFNYINELYKNKVPTFVVSAIFRKQQHFFQPWGGWSRRQLQKVTYFFVQNEKSLALLRMIKVYHADISGDTRFDRVLSLTGENTKLPVIDTFANGSELLIAGSTWPADEDVLLEVIKSSNEKYKLVIAPHEVHEEHIRQIKTKFEQFNPVLYSDGEAPGSDSKVLIIDMIGILASAYRYAFMAYIGGGFGVGIHNTLEAAVRSIPVIFGPNYHRFQEAVELESLGGGFSISNKDDCVKVFTILTEDKSKYLMASRIAGEFVRSNAGASGKVLAKAQEFIEGEW